MTDKNKRKVTRDRRNKQRKRNRRMLLLVLIGIIAIIAALSGGKGIKAAFNYDVLQEAGDPNAEVEELDADGAAIYCTDLDEIIFSKNGDKKIDPYSITKILTCYLALENLDEDKVITVSKKAATPLEDGTTIYLKEGEKISVKDLLYGAMLESGNDAATALGEAVSGSEKKFAKLMNEQAKEWGCEDTNFVNANGWKDDDHYTTANDMAVITAKSFENDRLREISATEEYTIPETNKTEERHISSHTFRGKKIKYTTCGKTGGWTSKDCSMAMCFEKKGLKGAAVALRTPLRSRKRDIAKMIRLSQKKAPGYLLEKGTTVCEAPIRGGAVNKTSLYVADKVYLYPKNHDIKGIKVEIDTKGLEAPVAKDAEVGTYTIFVDDKEIKSGKLFAAEDVKKGWLPSKLYISNKTTALLMMVLFLSVLLVILVSANNHKKAGKRDQS